MHSNSRILRLILQHRVIKMVEEEAEVEVDQERVIV